MTSSASTNLLAAQSYRYATKDFDPTQKISPEDWAVLEKCLVLTPSSFGLQPWKFIVITDQSVKESLLSVSWGQRQIVHASHVVVFAVKTDITENDVIAYMESIATSRQVPVESLAGFKKVILGFIAAPPFGLSVKDWLTRQVFIALGNFMTSAALIGIDTCPMEGFDPAKYDEILGLTAMGLRSVVTCPAGYRLETDKYAALPKVRFHASEMVLHI